MEQTEQLNEQFLDEYVSDDAVRKYTTETAGYGIPYSGRARVCQDLSGSN